MARDTFYQGVLYASVSQVINHGMSEAVKRFLRISDALLGLVPSEPL